MRKEAQPNEAVAVGDVKDVRGGHAAQGAQGSHAVKDVRKVNTDTTRHHGESRSTGNTERVTEVSRSTESREVRDRREAEARDKDNGWFGVFLSWIPNMLLALILVGLLFLGMFYIEHGTLNLGIETASPHAK